MDEIKNDYNYVINFYNDYKDKKNDLIDYLNLKFNDLYIGNNHINFNKLTNKRTIKNIIQNDKVYDKNNNSTFLLNPNNTNALGLGIFFLDFFYNLEANTNNIDKRYYD
jgi:hypothetical protein